MSQASSQPGSSVLGGQDAFSQKTFPCAHLNQRSLTTMLLSKQSFPSTLSEGPRPIALQLGLGHARRGHSQRRRPQALSIDTSQKWRATRHLDHIVTQLLQMVASFAAVFVCLTQIFSRSSPTCMRRSSIKPPPTLLEEHRSN